MNELQKDIRSDAFKKSIRFINYEIVEGDIIEFGVYSGRSLALLSYFHDLYYKNENKVNSKFRIDRKIYGLDSFEGLPDGEDHPRWYTNLFKKNHSSHPVIAKDIVITPEIIEQFFESIELSKPVIIKGFYNQINLDNIKKLALVHIDCDLYSSTKEALNLIKDKLCTGTVILFDDWFNFKADENMGEQKAFNEFLKNNKNIKAVEFLRYATFCKAFVLKGE